MFIYALVCPITEVIRYVGKSNNPKRRVRNHIRELKLVEKTGQYNHRQSWLKSLKDNGLNPVLVVLESVTEENWQEREMYWISFYLNLGCKLTNSTSGGDGGLNPSELTRKKMSDRKKGKPLSVEHKKRMSESQKARYQDPNERLKSSLYSKEINSRPNVKELRKESMKEIWKDPEHRAKRSSAISKAKQKYIYTIMYSDGRQETVLNLREWCSLNGYILQSMRQVASGGRKSCHGIRISRVKKE